jgi:hypothetical protein
VLVQDIPLITCDFLTIHLIWSLPFRILGKRDRLSKARDINIDKVGKTDKIDDIDKLDKRDKIDKIQKRDQRNKIDRIDKIETKEKVDKIDKIEKRDKIENELKKILLFKS